MGDSKNSSAAASGVSGVGVVQIVFIILKLCNTNPIGGWPWWKVMLPTEASVALICCCGCTGIAVTICALIGEKDNTVSTPGNQLSPQQRELLYNLTQETLHLPPPQLKVATPASSSTAAAAEAEAAVVMEEGNLSSSNSSTSNVRATHSNDMNKSCHGNTLETSNSSAFETISGDVN